MKKIIALFAVALFSTTIAHAAMTEAQTSEIETLRVQGFSESALRSIDTIKALNQGPNGTYQKKFIPKRNFLGKTYTTIKNYFDPAQDDNEFGHHQINFTNTFMNEKAHYAYPTKEVEVLDNL